VIFRDIDGVKHEPIEEVTIDVDDEYTGAVIDKLTGPRKGDLVEMKPAGVGKTRIIAHVPSRGLIGYHGQFLTDTRGTGVLNRIFHGWAPHKGPIQGRRAGRADLDGNRHLGRLCDVEPGRSRPHVHRRAGTGLYRHDHRRAQPRQRPGSEPAEGQEADQRPRLRHG
jgi:translation elongation factor EF-G